MYIFGLDPPTVKGGVLYFKTELSVHFSLLKMSTLPYWNSINSIQIKIKIKFFKKKSFVYKNNNKNGLIY